MRGAAHVVAASAVRLYAPLLVLFALALLARAPAGGGVGFIAGLVFGLAVAVHALVFGAASARSALPPVVARVLLAAGLMMAAAGAGAPNLAYAGQLIEAGLFTLTSVGAALILQVLFGRAPTLREAEWQ